MGKIAIIPARGGSKRIPRKNIKDFLGRPIIAYSIEAALQSGLFDEVMVSTEDFEIADIARGYGATIPFMRTEMNSSDFASTADVILEVLNTYSDSGRNFEQGCCIYPTAPFVGIAALEKGLRLLMDGGYDAVFPVVSFSYPIWRAFNVTEDTRKASMIWPDNLYKRSQDLSPAYHDAGQFYWFNTHALKQSKTLYSDNSGVIIQSELEVQDIDSLTDWQIAEIKYKVLHDAEGNY